MKAMRLYQNKFSLQHKLYRLCWQVVYCLLFRPTPSFCCYRWRNLLLRMFGARLGSHCRIRSDVKIWMPNNLIVGSFVAIGSGVKLYNVAPIRIGSNITLSQNCHLCTASHDIGKLDKPLTMRSISIQSHSWVAAEAFIGMGVTVGKGAVVGARACVFKDVEPWTVVGGNPARFIKKREIQD